MPFNRDAFMKLTNLARTQGWEKAKAAFPEIPAEQLEDHRAGVERAMLLPDLPLGGNEVPEMWMVAWRGGPEWDALRSALAAAGQLRG